MSYNQKNLNMSLERALEVLGKPTDVSHDPYYSRGNEVQLDAPGWIIYTRTRDSGIFDESNFATILSELCSWDEPEWKPEVLRMGHWACGWVERIFVSEDSPEDAIKTAASMVACLEEYPLLDDEDYCRREMEAMDEAWRTMILRDRIELIGRELEQNGYNHEDSDHKLTIFDARFDHPPTYMETLREWVQGD